MTTKTRRDVAPTDAEDVTVTDGELHDSADTDVDSVTDTDVAPDAPEDVDPDESRIVYYQQVTDPETGQATVKTHGPMPVADWAAYERENNL